VFLIKNNIMTKKNIISIITLVLTSLWIGNNVVNGQTVTPQVIASAGGYHDNISGSLSFTIGETNTQTLSSAPHMLTQGFQQPFELIINLKAFLQGYYVGSAMMNDVLYNQGQYANPSSVADSITIALHDATAPYNLAFSQKLIINQNGTTTIKGIGAVGQSYYIVLKHRNSIEIWSSNPITLSNLTNYDFTIAASQAYGSNQFEVESGVWALYSGDINQDWSIDAFDYLLLDPDIIAGAFGYVDTDLSGDGVVDAFDYLILDANLVNGVGAVMP
jgi:hypothetical protein